MINDERGTDLYIYWMMIITFDKSFILMNLNETFHQFVIKFIYS